MPFDYPTAFSSWQPYDDSREWKAYERVLRSTRLTMGPEVERFEQIIADWHGRKHAIATNSGSSANLVATAVWHTTLRLDMENHASVPAIAWATTYAPLAQHEFILAVNDVDDTWNAQITPAQCRVGCSILGNPQGIECDIEDNCESLGARVYGRLTGTFGKISTGSGFYSHQLSAVELGWVLTDDDHFADLARLYSNHGNDGWGKKEFEKQYDFRLFGYNVRAIETHAAVAVEQLGHMENMIEARRWNHSYFKTLTANLPLIHQKTKPYHSPFGLAFEVESREARSRLVKALREAGVDSRLPTGGSFRQHPYGIHQHNQLTPRADRIHERGMFLGNAPYLIPHLIERAVKVMKDVL